MSKPKTMNKDKLLGWLRTWYCDSRAIVDAAPSHLYLEQEQAYNQLKALIQNSPKVDEEFIEKWAIEIEQHNWKRWGAPVKFRDFKDLIKHLLQEAGYNIVKKSEITLKDIQGWADGIQADIKDHADWSYLTDGIKEMLKEKFGIKVIKDDKHIKK